MHTTCRQWIVEVLESHLEVLSLAVRQRAKLEGWLKFELAACAECKGFGPVSVEAGYGEGRSDITFHADSERFDVELKTSNTNWRIPGVISTTRPITKNIASIITDARKLEAAPGHGIVSFVLFPVPRDDHRWMVYLARIGEALDIPLSEAEHCARVTVPVEANQPCEVVVCCFSYPTKSVQRERRTTTHL
jgi:hypothetical protein